MNKLLHINRYILRFSLLLLVLFAAGNMLHAQSGTMNRTYNLEIDFTAEDETKYKDIYENEVYIWSFAYEEDAKAAESMLNSEHNPNKVRKSISGNKGIHAKEFGEFTIKVRSDGYILIWIDNLNYKSRIITVERAGKSEKIIIENNVGKEETTTQENKDKIEYDTLKDEHGKPLLDREGNPILRLRLSANANAKAITGKRTDINTSKEVNGVVTSRMDFYIPYRTTSNIRVVVQPMWFDRADFSDEESDTVFSYGKTFYHDKVEYKFTQKRRMAFDLKNDSLHRYCMSVANQRVYDLKGRDSICSNISFDKTSDTIHVFVLDTVSGFDPDYSHPYPFGAVVNIYDYNAKVHSVEKRGNGERKVPLKFLDFSFKEFLPNAAEFEVKLEEKPVEDSRVAKLNFANGKDYLIDDSANAAGLADAINFVKELGNESKYDLIEINITGIASPEGARASNEDLARRRAAFLRNKLAPYTDRDIHSYANVASWENVADTLRSTGHIKEADEVKAICEKHLGNMSNQSVEIARLPYYGNLLKDSILPKLRIVKYDAIYNEIRQKKPEEVEREYYKKKDTKFSRGEFWSLFDILKDAPAERERVARHALKVTRDPNGKYNEGYWAYAACLLACQYIARDTTDFNVLKPFLDFNLKDSICDTIRAGQPVPIKKRHYAVNDTVIEHEVEQAVYKHDSITLPTGVKFVANDDTIINLMKKDTIKAGTDFYAVENIILKRDTVIIHEKIKTEQKDFDKETKEIIKYTNFPAVAANQLIMALRQKDRSRNKDIPVLEAITASNNEAKYDTLLTFSKCLRGGYQAGGEFTEFEAEKVREIVSSTSTTNSVIIKLAMEDEANLNTAEALSKNLPDNAVSDYLMAVIKLRKKDNVKAKMHLATSFVRDLNMIPIACNDEDLLSPTDTENNTFVGGALKQWQDTMRTIVTIKKEAKIPAQPDSIATDSTAANTPYIDPAYKALEEEKEQAKLDEKYPFTWYIRALEMLGDKDETNDEEGKEALIKCFKMDKRYTSILNASLIKDNNIRKNEELKSKLKSIRNEYNKSK